MMKRREPRPETETEIPVATGRGRRKWWVLAAFVGAGLAIVFWPRNPNALPPGDWQLFKQRFLEASGRVVDTGNADVSHSEGQGYGMMLAVAFGDRPAFDRMWKWTQDHLRRADDQLFSWRYEPADGGKVDDPNNASDGDLLIAWALVRAGQRWDDYGYQQSAAQIVGDFFRLVVVESDLGLQMLPGLLGFQREDGLLLNPSYALFPAYQELREVFPSERWDDLDAGGRRLLGVARFGSAGLNPNWTTVGPLALRLPTDKGPLSGYDAIRVPLHVAWAGPNPELLAPYAAFWEAQPQPDALPAELNLRNGEPGPHPMLPGMQAIAQFALASASGSTITVADIPPLLDDESYFSASLKLLTKLAIRDRAAAKKN
jgi:endoglucanase